MNFDAYLRCTLSCLFKHALGAPVDFFKESAMYLL